MPATEVEYLPDYWAGVVRTMWAWQELERKRSMRKSKQRAPTDINAHRAKTRG